MFLPDPPSDQEKFFYVGQNKTFLYSFGLCSSSLLIAGGILFAYHKPEFYWFGIFLFMIMAYLGISYIVGFLSKPFSLEGHYDSLRDGNYLRPSIDIFLPSAGEPISVIANTYKHVKKLQSKASKKFEVKVFVLDDAANPDVKRAAEESGFYYISRPNRGELKKAGNIRYAFSRTDGDIILILDADFVPRDDFLFETVPYFANPKVGIVQTPQFFRVLKDQPWIQRGSATIQELFYRLIQVNRNHFGASICVGTNAMYRRSALAPFGGTYPIQHSEDVHTGFNLLKEGWKVVYIPINLASGICPDQVSSFFTQQYRWCMGSTSLFLNKNLFWKTNLTFMQRISFLSGMLYYQATAIGLILTPLPGIMMAWLSPEHVFWYNVVFSLPSFMFGTIHMAMWNKQSYGLFAIKTRNISYYAHLFALWDKMNSSVMDWIPTGDNKKTSSNSRVKKFRMAMALWTFFVPAAGFSAAFYNMESIYNYNFYPYLIITSFYFFLNISCFFEPRQK